MRRYWLGLAAASALSACSGGNPFLDDETPAPTPEPDPGFTIPEALAGDVESVSYDPVNETLTVTGVGLDSTPIVAEYTRNAALDRVGYQAYTTQQNALTEHSTAYIRQSEGGYATIVMTGGQFGHFQGGSTYGSDGSFSAPDVDPGDAGIVSYAGTYVGLLNMTGDGGDLIPADPGTDPAILPGQAAEVTGSVFINADFSDMDVKGGVYNRTVTDFPAVTVEDLIFDPTDIASDGSFTGSVEVDGGGVGEYGGIFSGTDAAAVAGTLHATGHIEELNDGTVPIEEFGVFVLDSCNGANADPACPPD